jgi:hypothetical protein
VKRFNITTLKPAATKTYYVSKTGSDANTGADWDHALRNVYTALITKGDADCVYVGAGVWDRTDAWQGQSLTRSCSIIGVGTVVFSDHQPGLTWSLTASQTNTYQTTRASTIDVLDAATLDSHGDYTRLSTQTSIATVEANPGSYWVSGSTVYVHTADNRAPDANILVMVSAYTAECLGNITVYVENIIFQGGTAALRLRDNAAGQTPTLYGLNCEFNYSSATTGNGLTLLGASMAILQNCTAKCNRSDGINGHIQDSILPKMILINCTARDNGETTDDDNGFTTHDAGFMVIVGGSAFRNKGPNIITSAASAWCLGTKAYASAASIAGARIDFNTTGGSGAMWLDRCTSYGSDNGIVAGATTTIKKKKCNATVADGGAGTVETY